MTYSPDPTLFNFLKEASPFSGFAKSLLRYYAENSKLTAKQESAARQMMKRWGKVRHERKVAERRPSSVDLSTVPEGLYAVPGGDTRLKVRISHNVSKGEKWINVYDGAVYGQQSKYGFQPPGGLYRGKIVEELRTIAADPRAASAAYGRLTSTCGVCGRALETEESVARGIGSVCAGRF